MAEIQVRCLYDFQGDLENGELTFYTDETLDIIRQDIGDGWWEARNQSGDQGLIPETYVEVISVPEPQFPPPPPPMVSGNDAMDGFGSSAIPPAPPLNGFGGGGGGGMMDNRMSGGSYGGGGNASASLPTQESIDDWDDDWDDDEDERSSNSTLGQSQEQGGQLQGQGNFGLSAPKREGKQLSPTGNQGGEMSKYGTVKSSFSRFSQFAKTGGESFLMGQADERVPESDRIRIVETEDGPVWLYQDSPYTCTVTSPKKESKMKGLKSFISYQLTPSFSNIVVSRRYKHFDWLHERLEAKFVCIPISPLPDKAVTGRYEDDFIQERMRALQAWVNRMVRHPVISRSDVFHHFLTCTDDKKWKMGKRKAEKDEFQGGKFFQVLSPPEQYLDAADIEKKMEIFCKMVNNMTENTKHLVNVHHDYAKKQFGPFKREFEKIGHAYKALAQAFNLDNGARARSLTTAIDYTGDAFNDIGEMFSKQPPRDAFPLIEALHEYKGILHVYPDVLKVHEGAIGKAKECRKLQEESKMTEEEVRSVMRRADTITYGTIAEMTHFQQERVSDFKSMMQAYLREQIDFYKNLTGKLEDALARYDSV